MLGIRQRTFARAVAHRLRESPLSGQELLLAGTQPQARSRRWAALASSNQATTCRSRNRAISRSLCAHSRAPPPLPTVFPFPVGIDGARWLSSRSARNKGGGKGRGSGSASAGGGAETAEPVLTFQGVSKQLPGGRELFSHANLSFVRGAKVGVLGVNGSGKSTVLKILAGQGMCWVEAS